MKIKNLYQEKSLLLLINKHFWKSKIGPIASLCLPLFMMIIYKIIGETNNTIFASGLASYFSFSILPVCLITLPQMLVELKNSIILRKISVSKITPIKFNIIILLYYLCILILSNLTIITLYATFLNVDAPSYFREISWGELVYTLIMIYISCLSFGLLLGVLIKKSTYVQISGFLIMIISISLSGQFMPLTGLARSLPIKILSLFSPLSYALNLTNNVLVSTNHELYSYIILSGLYDKQSISPETIDYLLKYEYNGIFDLKNPFVIFSATFSPSAIDPKIKIMTELSYVTIYDIWQNILDLTMPFFLTGLFLYISVKKFNWTSR